jgi:hypothetical protein
MNRSFDLTRIKHFLSSDNGRAGLIGFGGAPFRKCFLVLFALIIPTSSGYAKSSGIWDKDLAGKVRDVSNLSMGALEPKGAERNVQSITTGLTTPRGLKIEKKQN